jgi:type II secretory pathway component PulF
MTNPAAAPVINTKPGTDRDRFFLFSQLSAAFRAGLNPVQTFSEIAQRAKPNYKESLEALAKAAVEGGSLARTMARYPDLYPEHVVGMTEAGQQGGFLPDAFEQISLQAQSAHKFKRWFFWIWIVSINALLLIPGMWWAGKAMVATWDAIDASGGAGGSSGGTKSMLHAFWQILLWPVGPVFLLMSFAVWGMYTYFGSRRAKGFRHRLGLRFPIYGARARHENLSIFSWALARLSHSGIAPANAYRLAAYTAPNVEMRNELVTLASNLSGAEKMSDIVGRSKIFPEEYAPVIATAEYTGDLPNAFQQLADMNKSEFQLSETNAKLRSGCWGILAVLLAGVIGSGIFFHFYGDLQQHVLGDQGWLTPLR